MTLHNTKAIIDFLDNYLFTRNLPYIAPIEANKLLEQEGLLNDSSARPGKPLRDLLRAGRFRHAIQPGGFNTEWFIPHSERNIVNLLREQVLIWVMMHDNYSVFEIIERAINNDVEGVQFNHFFASCALQYYRSIIVDLGTLYLQSKTHKSRFQLLLSPIHSPFLVSSVSAEIKRLLEVELKDSIEHLSKLRNTQYAHNDFIGKETVTHDFLHLEDIRRLYKSSIKIIDMAATGNLCVSIEIAVPKKSESANALKVLIKQIGKNHK